MKKIYMVTFCAYTDVCEDTISLNDVPIKDKKYIHVGHDPFLISEDQIDHYMQYGGGIKDMIFVGCMEDE